MKSKKWARRRLAKRADQWWSRRVRELQSEGSRHPCKRTFTRMPVAIRRMPTSSSAVTMVDILDLMDRDDGGVWMGKSAQANGLDRISVLTTPID